MKYSLKGHVGGDSQRHNRSRDHVTTSEPAWQVSKSFVVAFIISMHGHGLGFHVGSNMRGVTANEQDGK
jgi:ABC-type transporter Mla maintaining outer membrane lipid asymmetry permease subunit MlaE